MAFPAVALLDNFNRTAENPLSNGGKWKALNGRATGQVVGELWTGTAAFPIESEAYWSAAEYPQPAVSVLLRNVNKVAGHRMMLWACVSKPTEKVNGYWLEIKYEEGVFIWILRKQVNGLTNVLAEKVGGEEPAIGDSIGLTVSKGVITAWHKEGAGAWKEVISHTDVSSPYATGFVGMGEAGEWEFDDFSAGSSPVPLTGTVIAKSGFTATMHSHLKLTGTVTSTSAFKAGMEPNLAGKVTSTSVFKAGMEPNLAGKVTSTSAFKAGMEPNLAGKVTSTSVFKAGMEPNLAGKVTSTSAFTATMHSHLKLTGTVTGTSAFKAGMEPRLAGNVTSTSAFTATLQTHQLLTGSISSTAAFSAGLEPRLAGGIAAISAFNASLTEHQQLAGSISIAANFTAGMEPKLGGRIVSSSAFGATFLVHELFTGSISATSAFKGTLHTHLKLEGPPPDANRATNPSFEYGITGWIAEKNTVTQTEEQAFSGTHSLRGERTSATEGTLLFYKNTPGTLGKPETYWDGPVNEGETYTLSGYLRAATTARNGHAAIAWYNEKRELISSSSGAIAADSAAAWTRYSVTAVAPAGAVAALLRFNVPGLALNEVHYLDALQFTATPGVITYADGDSGAGWHWEGAPGASISLPEAVEPVTLTTTSRFTGGMVPRLGGHLTGDAAFTAAFSSHQQLSGTISASSAFSAGLYPRLAGTVVSISAFNGALIVHGQFSGSVTCTSAFKGGLEPRLAGSVSSTAAFTASIKFTLHGSISSNASFTFVGKLTFLTMVAEEAEEERQTLAEEKEYFEVGETSVAAPANSTVGHVVNRKQGQWR